MYIHSPLRSVMFLGRQALILALILTLGIQTNSGYIQIPLLLSLESEIALCITKKQHHWSFPQTCMSSVSDGTMPLHFHAPMISLESRSLICPGHL